MTNDAWLERVTKYHSQQRFGHLGEELNEIVKEDKDICSWDDFRTWVETKPSWLFRGQREHTWHLLSTFDRRAMVRIKNGYWKINPHHHEHELLREFRQAAHHYCTEIPENDRHVDWLSLMQHHGGPTRLLDWTESPYVALYFALAETSDAGATVWAVDQKWIDQTAPELYRNFNISARFPDAQSWHSHVDKVLLTDTEVNVIAQVHPSRLNRRMLAQQGRFLATLGYPLTFARTLLSMVKHGQQPVVSRVNLPRSIRIAFLRELQRMNIGAHSLFPDLDGFCKSIDIRFQVAIETQKDDRRPDLESWEDSLVSPEEGSSLTS